MWKWLDASGQGSCGVSSHRKAGARWKALLWGVMAMVGVWGGDVALVQAKPSSFSCTGRLRPTRSRRVTCRTKPWTACPTGAVVLHPGCQAACRQRWVQPCVRIQARQRRRCRRKPKDVLFCPDLAKRWRRRCVTVSQAAQEVCKRRADVTPCRETFETARERCGKAQKKDSGACLRTFRKRQKACRRLVRAWRLRREKACKTVFAKCLRRCVPMRWPCRKRCFARRHRCLQKGRERVWRCRETASRLQGECDIQADQAQTRCTQKAESTMYACMQKLRRKRLVCLLRVGKRYTECVHKAHGVQLQCWFRKMGREHLCSGAALRECRTDQKRKLPRCLRRCPRCRVTAASRESNN